MHQRSIEHGQAELLVIALLDLACCSLWDGHRPQSQHECHFEVVIVKVIGHFEVAMLIMLMMMRILMINKKEGDTLDNKYNNPNLKGGKIYIAPWGNL